MNENQIISNPPTTPNEFKTIVLAIKIVIVAVILIPVIRYVLISTNNNDDDKTAQESIETDTVTSENQNVSGSDDPDDVNNIDEMQQQSILSRKLRVRKRTVVVVPQSTCPSSFILVMLQEICAQLHFKNAFCLPEDVNDLQKHRVPAKIVTTNGRQKATKEAKVPAIINYAVGGLLMFSLGAAFVELYKAKKNHPNKKDGKNPLSRKCSLADLTVLKHHRKELVRRESILEEDGGGGGGAGSSSMTSSVRQAGRKVSSRLPLRLD